MASENRTAAHYLALSKELHEKPYKFGFFQTLRLIECAHRDKPRIGQSLRPVDDPVRLAQTPSMTFAPSTLSAFKPQTKDQPAVLSSYFFGLLGPNGPLPLHLTEHARERIDRARDDTFSAFLDVFHHRMLSLFYRAWAVHQPTVSYDRPDSDQYKRYVGSLFGLGMPSLHNRDEMPDSAKLYYAGLFANQTHHASGLESMLQDFFHIPVKLNQFIGEWIAIPEHCQIKINGRLSTMELGVDSNIGSRVWSSQLKFRLEFGPLNYEQFKSLLPGSKSLSRLAAIVRNYTGDELSWDIKLLLKRDQIPAVKLDGENQFGWTTWLHSDSRQNECEETIINYTSIINSGDTDDRN